MIHKLCAIIYCDIYAILVHGIAISENLSEI